MFCWRFVDPTADVDAGISRVGLRGGLFEAVGYGGGDFYDGAGSAYSDGAYVAAFDVAATAHHRD
jgi:hypothetical protein